MKILILALYYNRPKLLRNALQSVLTAHEHYKDWELVFGDDNSPVPGEPIVREILHEHMDRVKCINSKMTLEDKLSKGLMVGHYANQAMQSSNADLVITLCDDDQLVPTYLRDLSIYFISHPEEMYAYSHVSIYNPLFEIPKEFHTECSYNINTTPINPAGKVDSSQVAFRRRVIDDGVCYPESSRSDEKMPWLENPDSSLFSKLFEKYGPARYTGLVAQYKGIHDFQLVWHKKNTVGNLQQYVEKVDMLGGSLF